MLQMSELDGDSLFGVANFITQDEQQNITLSSLFFKEETCSMPAADLPDGSLAQPSMPAATYKILLFRARQGARDGSVSGAEGAQVAGAQHVADDASPLKGVISFSDGGQILHCLKFTSDAEKAEFCKLIATEIPHDQVFCILGEKEGCELIASAVKKKRRQTRHYTLMHYAGNVENQLPPKKLPVPEKLELVKCGTPQLDALTPLQQGYELDEVLIDKADFDETTCRLTMRKFLREQIIYALFTEQREKAVAKAGTNARGLNWYQLGGVYTVPQYRGKGCAAFLAQTLALKNAEIWKKTALFVKDVNIPAQKAYAKAGFVPDNPFEIIYY